MMRWLLVGSAWAVAGAAAVLAYAVAVERLLESIPLPFPEG